MFLIDLKKIWHQINLTANISLESRDFVQGLRVKARLFLAQSRLDFWQEIVLMHQPVRKKCAQ